MTRAGIALGSNLGDRAAQLRAARAALEAVSGGPVLCGGIYQTAPVDCPPGSPDFYNTVVEIGWAGPPDALHTVTRGIERSMGRPTSAPRNAPRVVDLDLLYVGDAMCCGPELVLPHPRLASRGFVLRPLADIRPELVLPGQHLAVGAMLSALADAAPPLLVASVW